MGNRFFTFSTRLGDGSLNAMVSQCADSVLFQTGHEGGRQQIGRWQTTLPPAELIELERRLDASAYRSFPQPKPAEPESPAITLGEGTGTGLPQVTVLSQAPLTPPILKVFGEWQRLVELLRRHPHHVLEGAGGWKQPEITASQELEFWVSLRNAGPHPLSLLHPAADHGGLVGRALAVARDIPDDQFDADRDLGIVNVAAGEVRAVDAQGQDLPPGRLLDLVPGAVVHLWVRKSAYLEPGAWRASMVLRTAPADIPVLRRSDGTLEVRLGPLRIAK
jgi:hypothetical protein